MQYFFLVPLVLALIIFGPFMTIWAVSVLFDVPAVYDFWHWLAVFALGSGSLLNAFVKKD